MTLKKLLALLLALCLLCSLAACGESEKMQDPDKDQPSATASPTDASDPDESSSPTAPSKEDPAQTVPAGPADESQITPLLYKVTDEAGNVAWLFGSIHVGLESYYPLPDYVLSAYEGADALAVECDIVAFASDFGAQTDALMQLLYLDGTRISDHLSEELYTRAVEVMKECDMYMSMLDMYYPIMWSSFIDSALVTELGADSEMGIDMYFLNDAHDTEKEIIEVESVQFQYGMMGGFSEELQIMLLESSIYSYEHMDEYEADLNALMEAWASGDEDAISEIILEEPEYENAEEEALYKEYNDAMSVTRNIAMADYAEEALASGKEVFICVGTAHVVGEGAMADLLAQRGYTVELVAP